MSDDGGLQGMMVAVVFAAQGGCIAFSSGKKIFKVTEDARYVRNRIGGKTRE